MDSSQPKESCTCVMLCLSIPFNSHHMSVVNIGCRCKPFRVFDDQNLNMATFARILKLTRKLTPCSKPHLLSVLYSGRRAVASSSARWNEVEIADGGEVATSVRSEY
jgi:hypothetical protein